jgi:DNA-binding CsgD family transcriptional regulator/PAS domain-containing protein
VLEIAGALQRTATAKEVEAAFLRSIARVVRAGGYGLYRLDPEDLRPIDVAATVPDSFLERYEAEGRADDPVLHAAVGAGRPVDSSRLPPGRCWVHAGVLAVLRDAGFYHSLEAPVVVDGEVRGTVNMARPEEEGPFSAGDLAAVGAVAEHVGAALARAERYELVSARTVLLADALDAASQPIVITTVDGELIFHNRMAARQVPGSTTTYLERAQPVLRAALEELRSGAHRVVTTHERPAAPRRATRPSEASLPPVAAKGGIVAVKAVRLRASHDTVVSFVSHREVRAPGLPEGALPLSRREREIADLVSQGLTTRQIAELSYVSENTVKQHLKRIFGKLEVHSRAELVQAVWRAATAGDDAGGDVETTALD